MYDFCDGQIYNQHPLFSGDDRALQLVVYTDEVETANPLGSYRGHHKLSKGPFWILHDIIYLLIYLSSGLLLPYWEYRTKLTIIP